ncbi:RNA 3'-terminal phosphate cyclase [Halosolutus amylolyticus]|uniref:RNA 3'-terminal phosphate cyclase n=1 Tax=Halosolutus amylolyticus TaxID=2932267 RepID=A0ABD5PRD1_9EURY|nr:RNA 3'-terminal phosphate cyclase [Halosolutus amylolyticus]
MRELDGSIAGGQFVRSALALSVLRNEPIRIENVRGDRSTPGLRHQHLAVLETMVAICDAEVAGAELGSETVEFDPALEGSASDDPDRGRLPGGTYATDIGTAGSVTLLFEALLPLATILDAPLSITATGGTDVKWSPPIDYVRHVKLPLAGRYGLVATCEADRRGFYPEGGGRATLRLAPSTLDPIDLTERGPIEDVRLYSTEAASLADRDVAHRQAEGALERLDRDGETDRSESDGAPDAIGERCETTAESRCPGSAIVIRVDHGTGVAGFSALGERGKPAERVGEDAADAANRWLDGTAPVDRHVADQLLVLLAVAGGRVRVPAVTDHVDASCDLLRSFGIEPSLEDDGETTIVSIESPIDG